MTKLGDVTIGGSWKITLVKCLFVLILAAALFGGIWWAWQTHKQGQQTIADLKEQQAEIEQRYEALQVRVEESSKRTERRLEAVAIQAQEYARDSDIAVLIDDLNAELDSYRRNQVRPGN